MNLPDPVLLFLILPGILFSITFHEFAHAYTASLLGDQTAKNEGRVTLNPAAHFDPMGLLFILMTIFVGVGFGWGKPVPVNPARLKTNLNRILVTAAGPASNFFLAFTATYLHKILTLTINVPDALHFFLQYLIIQNVALGVFNLAPVPPLDGFTILSKLLPYELSRQFESLRAYGFIPLLIFIYSPLYKIIWGPMKDIINFLMTIGNFI